MEAGFNQDSVVSSSQDYIHKWNHSTMSGLHSSLKPHKGGKLKAQKECVWLKNFFRICQEKVGIVSLKTLIDNMNHFTDKVARHVALSYSSAVKATRMKGDLLLVMHYFHLQYLDLNLMLDDDSGYLEKMSHLMTMYLDMEVKASRRRLETAKKITSKLISSLLLFLRSSPDHIMNTILNSQLLKKCYNAIWIPIFKCATDLPITENLTYVRCLLIFKLWKRFSSKGEEKSRLNELASAKLPSVPDYVLGKMQRGLFIKVLPLLPANTEPHKVTKFYMTTKFNVQDSIKGLFKWVKENKEEEFIPMEEPLRLFDETTENDNLLLFDDADKDNDHLDQLWSNLNISNNEANNQSRSESSQTLGQVDNQIMSSQNIRNELTLPTINSSYTKTSHDLNQNKKIPTKKLTSEKEIFRNTKNKPRKVSSISDQETCQELKNDSMQRWNLQNIMGTIAVQQRIRDNVTAEASNLITGNTTVEQLSSEALLSNEKEGSTLKESINGPVSKSPDINLASETEFGNQSHAHKNLCNDTGPNSIETQNQESLLEKLNASLISKSTFADNPENEETNEGIIHDCQVMTDSVDLIFQENSVTSHNTVCLQGVTEVKGNQIKSSANKVDSLPATDQDKMTSIITNQQSELSLIDNQLKPKETVIQTVNTVIRDAMEPSITTVPVHPKPDSVNVFTKGEFTFKEHNESTILKTTVESKKEETDNIGKIKENVSVLGYADEISDNRIHKCNRLEKLNVHSSHKNPNPKICEKLADEKPREVKQNIANQNSNTSVINTSKIIMDSNIKQIDDGSNKSPRFNLVSKQNQSTGTKKNEDESKSTQLVRPAIPAQTKVGLTNKQKQTNLIDDRSLNISKANSCKIKPTAVTANNKPNANDNKSRIAGASISHMKFDKNSKENLVSTVGTKPTVEDSTKKIAQKALENVGLIDPISENIKNGKIRVLSKDSNQYKPSKGQCLKNNKETQSKNMNCAKLIVNNLPPNKEDSRKDFKDENSIITKENSTIVQNLPNSHNLLSKMASENLVGLQIVTQAVSEVETTNKQTNSVLKKSCQNNINVNFAKRSSVDVDTQANSSPKNVLNNTQITNTSQPNISSSSKNALGENQCISTNDQTLTNKKVSSVTVVKTSLNIGEKAQLTKDSTVDSMNVANDPKQNPTTESELKSESIASDCRFATSCSKVPNTNHSITNLLYPDPGNIDKTFENLDVGQEITIKQESPFNFIEDYSSSLPEDFSDKGCSSRPLYGDAAEDTNTDSEATQREHTFQPELNTCLLHKILGESSSKDSCDECILESSKCLKRAEKQPSVGLNSVPETQFLCSSTLQPQEIRVEQWEITSSNNTTNLNKNSNYLKDIERIKNLDSSSGFEIAKKYIQESSSLAEDCGSESSDSNLVIDEEADLVKDQHTPLFSEETNSSNKIPIEKSGHNLKISENISRDLGTHPYIVSARNQLSCLSSNINSILKEKDSLEKCKSQHAATEPTVNTISQHSESTDSGLGSLQKAGPLEQGSSFINAHNNSKSSQVRIENNVVPLKKIKLTHPSNLTTTGSLHHWHRPFSQAPTSEKLTNIQPSKQIDASTIKLDETSTTGQIQYLEMQQNCLIGPNVLRTPPHYNNSSPALPMTYHHRNLSNPEIQTSYQSCISTSPHLDKPLNILSNPYQNLNQTKQQTNTISRQQYFESSSAKSYTNSLRSPATVTSETGYFNHNMSNVAYANVSSNPHVPGSRSAGSDPLCLVVSKSKEECREQYYEFEGFPVAQEVEVYSAPEVTVAGSSEISNPDWQIADQSVVDTSIIPKQEPFATPPVSSTSHSDESDSYFFNGSNELHEITIKYTHPELYDQNYEETMTLHLTTLEIDYEVLVNQKQFKDSYLVQNLSPTIPVPFPTKVRTDLPRRCPCIQCNENYRKLFDNYNILTLSRNCKVKFSDLPKTPEKESKLSERSSVKEKPIPIQPPENQQKTSERQVFERDVSFDNDCSLPLKKRKTLTNTNVTSLEQPKMTSYPNTPMISIAELEHQRNQVIVSNPQSPWKPPSPSCPVTRQASLRIAQNLSKPASQENVKTNKKKPSRRRRSNRG